MSTRALGSIIGVVLLLAVAVLTAAAVGVTALGVAPPEDAPTRAAFELRADADADRLTLVHRGGDTVAVSALRVRVRIDGRPLTHQPPVPFFAATGFESGPTGPFNTAAAGDWQAGERANFRLASTNEPTLEPGSQVTVELYLDGQKLAELETVA
ncbi:type IV pilin [Halorientalis pallida]|uniref:Type IV pilin n=1 Tax=Halorientalis pallida TaxID=2479928 RepID=A0A498KZ09_9EURY|nr:type IV pilin [Halorientalis pallida]RXK50518.1 type IV pilin [Halorientalis pallida]